MSLLHNVLIGITVAGNVLANPRPYTSPDNGFFKDKQELQSDSRKVVKDFNKQIAKEYGNQKYSGEG